MNLIMDPKPIAHPRHRIKARPAAAPPRDSGTLFLEGLAAAGANIVQRAVTAQAQLLHFAGQMVAGGPDAPVGELLQQLPELASPAEPLPFNQNCRGPQKLAWTEMPLAEIKAIKNACGATVNDVALALVTTAMRKYSELHGAKVKGRLLRIMVPVNMRNGDDHSLGNHISLLPVTVPLDIRDPRKLLAAVHAKMEFLKRAHVAELVALTGTLAGLVPAPLQAFALPIATQLPIHLWNLVCTNVPGPQFPVYLLRHKMLRWYPFVPIGGNMAVNCAILSYDGTVCFGFRGDIHAAPDLERIEGFLDASFEELRKAANIKPSRKRVRHESKAERVHSPAPTGENLLQQEVAAPESAPEPQKVRAAAAAGV
jgi:diacylglycerol O-acyltransferase